MSVALVFGPGEGTIYTARGSRMEFKAVGAHTDGTFTVGGRDIVAGAGTFVLVPKEISHTFGNRSEAGARLLIIHAPAADAYFAELHELWSGSEPPAKEQVDALLDRHGMRPA